LSKIVIVLQGCDHAYRQMLHQQHRSLGSSAAPRQHSRGLVRAHAVEAPAKLSATDRVKLGDSDLEVSGKLWL